MGIRKENVACGKRLLCAMGLTGALLMPYKHSRGQLPACSPVAPGLIYYIQAGQIYNYNPALPVSPTNPVANTLPALANGNGLAVSNNINGSGPSPTFYISTGGGSSPLYYWNGIAWISTAQNIGVNIGGSGNYIFNNFPGVVSRYNGSTITTVVPAGFGSGHVYDVAGDCEGNFYVMFNSGGSGFLRKYDFAGVALQTFTLVGPAANVNFTGYAGLGFINGEFYYGGGLSTGISIYKGVPSGNTLNVSLHATLPGITPSDFATCPGLPLAQGTIASVDTAYACAGSTTPLPLSVTGVGPFTWSVVSGTATLSSTTGSAITVTSPSPGARVRVIGSRSC